MSENLPAGDNKYYGLFEGYNQVGFICYANYVPHFPGRKKIFHANRAVIHPDYAGFGLGIQLFNITAALMMASWDNIKIMSKFSSIPVYKAMSKSPHWGLYKIDRKLGKTRPKGNMNRGRATNQGFRDGGVTSFSFTFLETPLKDIING